MTDVLEPAPDARAQRSPWEVGRERAPQRRRLLIGLAVLLVAVSIPFGFPTGREVITAWLLVFLFAVVGGDWAAWRRAVVRDWAPLLAVLFAYDLLRGFADSNAERAHVTPMIRFDETVFGQVPTTWLQDKLLQADPTLLDIVLVPVYMSHFVVPIGVAAGLWAVSYRRFRSYVATFITLTVLTLATYAAYPAVPPWLAAETVDPDTGQTYLPEVTRVVSRTLSESGIPTIHNAVQRGEAYANPVAAIPSLHAAVPMLVLLTFWGVLRWRGRALLSTYVVVMAFTLVYGGEHYVIDVLLGWAYAAGAVLAVAGVARWRRSRAERDVGEPEPTCR